MNSTLKTEDFDFKALLGEGTFGRVYLVKRRKDEKQFVVKKQTHSSENVWNNKILSAEVECLQTLRHPNIVSYYGAWQESGNFYILMEYAACGTLKHLLDERSRFFVFICTNTVGSTSHTLKNILHRDLKPENIMLTGRMGDIVKIGDFGLSRNLQQYNQSHAGSYYYLAPEMLKKHPYDFKSDIWSMGVVLYEMLTKELAFPASSIEEIIKMICKEKPRLFKSQNKYISRGTKIIVYKMLQQDTSMRPSTRLLLLCPYLVSYIAKVYLNLGRSYAIPANDFKLDVFYQFLKITPKS